MEENYLIEDSATEASIRQFEIQAVNFAMRFIQDADVRMDYMHKTK